MFVTINAASVAKIWPLSSVTPKSGRISKDLNSRFKPLPYLWWRTIWNLTQVRVTATRLRWRFFSILVEDRAKIERLPNLIDLSLNENPLGVIPSFHQTKILFLSLQNTSLISAEFPSSYNASFLQTISLNGNKIRSINEKDLLALRNTNLDKLHLHNNELSSIDRNAFVPLTKLQALSLKNNRLTSCEFLPTLPLLSAINLDGNQFVSLPQELSLESKIQVYSFKQNSISTIDESSPLHTWWKKNYTNKIVYLANNSLDCCQSVWLIRFLKSSRQFVGDAASLECAGPPELMRKKLISLDPDQLNCDGGSGRTRWTVGRIIGVLFGSIATTVIMALMVILTIRSVRRRRSLSGYRPIDGSDDSSRPLLLPPATYYDDARLPIDTADDEDSDSIYTSVSRARSTTHSEATTLPSHTGTDAIDGSLVEGSRISEAALIPPLH